MRCLTLTSSASCFYHSAFVHMLKHKFSELIHIVAAFLALTDLSPFFAGMNHIQYQRIDPRQ